MSTATREFIGRTRDITFLKEWLATIDAPSIVYIHDALEEKEKKGGTGKTWLLRRFYELVEQSSVRDVIPVAIDFFNVQDRDSITITQRVIQAINKKYPHWSASQFEKHLQDYHETTRGRQTEMAALRERLADAFVADLLMLQQRMIESDTYLLLFFD